MNIFLINYSYSYMINNYRYHLIHITIFYDNKDRLIDIELWNKNMQQFISAQYIRNIRAYTIQIRSCNNTFRIHQNRQNCFQ